MVVIYGIPAASDSSDIGEILSEMTLEQLGDQVEMRPGDLRAARTLGLPSPLIRCLMEEANLFPAPQPQGRPPL